MDLGKYEILEELGRGGFGIVYKARDKALNRLVAIKVLHPNLVNDPTFLGRFRQEAQIAARLDHPNLVPVHDFGESEGHYYIVMGYMPGGSLKDLIKQEGSLISARALEIMGQIASGLAYAHKKGVIHRDLKPGNILFDEEGTARISDMGFAKLLQSDSSMSMSTTGGLVGTPAYMAPEIWKGETSTAAVDVYSSACILVEMLTGKPLFDGDSTPVVILKHLQPVNLPENLPEGWTPVVEQALEKKPEDRIESVTEFISRLHLAERSSAKESPDKAESAEQDAGLDSIPLRITEQQPDLMSASKSDRHSEEQPLAFQETDVKPYQPKPKISEGNIQETGEDKSQEPGNPIVQEDRVSIYIGLGLLAIVAYFFVLYPWPFYTSAKLTTAQSSATQIARQTTQTAEANALATTTQAARITQTAVANVQATATVQSINHVVTQLTSSYELLDSISYGTLLHEEDDSIETRYLEPIIADFVLTTTFYNPYSADSNPWDYGFFFRNNEQGDFALIIRSSGWFELFYRPMSDWDNLIIINYDYSDRILTSGHSNNKLKIAAIGDTGYLWINNKFITKLDLSENISAGTISIGTGFYNGSEVDGEETLYSSVELRGEAD